MIETTVDLETPTISAPPGTIIGYRVNGQPIYNIAGGSVEVTDDVDDDDDDDSETSEEVEDEWVPPTKKEYEELLAKKSKADSEAAARKRFLRDNGFDPKTGKPVAKLKLDLDLDDNDDEDDSEDEAAAAKVVKGETRAKSNKSFERQLEREIAKTERRVKDEAVVLLSAVPTALNDAGWNGRNLERMIKLLDLDEIQVDSDGEIDGLLDQVEELKKDFPEFFKRQRMKEAAKEVADTATVGGGKKKAPVADTNLDWTERLKQSLYGA